MSFGTGTSVQTNSRHIIDTHSRHTDAVKSEVKGNPEYNEVNPFNTTTTTSTDNYNDETNKDSENAPSDEARVKLGFVDVKFIGLLMPS